ncbi:hypothetical protein BDZ85DRAFT_95989 [Elsinoe ampelina]|uniref:Uncharacterized protein n=1 Tax=Elsinoe ampelina TaxID=302913 RepID=A0A6A6GE84_9PEZI|nr:hypothetical protein BDZ85DRAFT_95989 [Elsinoe ampelina]
MKRGEARLFTLDMDEVDFEFSSAPYPSTSELLTKLRKNPTRYLQRAFNFTSDHLYDHNVGTEALPTTKEEKNLFVTEHILELQTVQNFINFATTGKVADKDLTITSTQTLIPKKYFVDNWTKSVLPPDLSVAKRLRKGRLYSAIPNQRVFEVFGSNPNIGHFVLCGSQLNGAKAKMWDLIQPVAMGSYLDEVKDSANPKKYVEGDRTKADPESRLHLSKWMSQLRLITGVSAYMNHVEVKKRLWLTINDVRAQMKYIDEKGPSKTGSLLSLWDEYIEKFFDRIDEHMKIVMSTRLVHARTVFEAAQRNFEDDRKKKTTVCNTGQKRPIDNAHNDLPQYIAFGLEGIKRYEAAALKMKMPREKDLSLDTSVAIDLAAAIKAIDLVGSTPAPEIKFDGLGRAPNVGDFVAAPMGLKTGADVAGNAGGNIAGLAAALAKGGALAAPA